MATYWLDEHYNVDEIDATTARRLLEEAAADLTGDARLSYEGSGSDQKNEAIIEIQRGGDPCEIVRAMWS